MVISWHTALHEYAGRRLERSLQGFGEQASNGAGQVAERFSLGILGWFYRRARVVLAPNQELVEMLKEMTHRPVFLMKRGVDTELFSPARRRRASDRFRLGYVGRLTPEKNVRFLAELCEKLRRCGRHDFELMLVGQGGEEEWLRQNVPEAIFDGVLAGEALANAYANMDAFVFPSKTDTFGNVVLEALSSGVPAVVTNEGGPKFLIQDSVTGFVAQDDAAFVRDVESLMTDAGLHARMSTAARQYACEQSWDTVFDGVYEAYRLCLQAGDDVDGPDESALLSSRLHERGHA
jgi:glycosyltransferase involved in cell wall biosynthesis